MADAEALRLVEAMVEGQGQGGRPLRAVLTALNRTASGKVKGLMEQLDGQLRTICVPGRSSASIGEELLHLTRVSSNSMRKILEVQKEEKLGAALDGWKDAAAASLDGALGSLRDEMAEKARQHGTISDERISRMQRVAQHEAMGAAERKVWDILYPQLSDSKERVAELEESLDKCRRQVEQAQEAAGTCAGAAATQTKLLQVQLVDMEAEVQKKEALWKRQRARNVEFEKKIAELER